MLKLTDCQNRRVDTRIRCFQRTHYLDRSGLPLRTELLNVSKGGAKLTTKAGVPVGASFDLFEQSEDGKHSRSRVVVRWRRVLPGGARQIVGVERISATGV